ncbi:basic proline-rich protein-like, partial [Cyprinodon tularosa]|uniref:basic proline-rich protein-like n=1 Tax=Cyprinodon tularosa TaxID=77115 RepID=UPI0018E1F00B
TVYRAVPHALLPPPRTASPAANRAPPPGSAPGGGTHTPPPPQIPPTTAPPTLGHLLLHNTPHSQHPPLHPPPRPPPNNLTPSHHRYHPGTQHTPANPPGKPHHPFSHHPPHGPDDAPSPHHGSNPPLSRVTHTGRGVHRQYGRTPRQPSHRAHPTPHTRPYTPPGGWGQGRGGPNPAHAPPRPEALRGGQTSALWVLSDERPPLGRGGGGWGGCTTGKTRTRPAPTALHYTPAPLLPHPPATTTPTNYPPPTSSAPTTLLHPPSPTPPHHHLRPHPHSTGPLPGPVGTPRPPPDGAHDHAAGPGVLPPAPHSPRQGGPPDCRRSPPGGRGPGTNPPPPPAHPPQLRHPPGRGGVGGPPLGGRLHTSPLNASGGRALRPPPPSVSKTPDDTGPHAGGHRAGGPAARPPRAARPARTGRRTSSRASSPQGPGADYTTTPPPWDSHATALYSRDNATGVRAGDGSLPGLHGTNSRRADTGGARPWPASGRRPDGRAGHAPPHPRVTTPGPPPPCGSSRAAPTRRPPPRHGGWAVGGVRPPRGTTPPRGQQRARRQGDRRAGPVLRGRGTATGPPTSSGQPPPPHLPSHHPTHPTPIPTPPFQAHTPPSPPLLILPAESPYHRLRSGSLPGRVRLRQPLGTDSPPHSTTTLPHIRSLRQAPPTLVNPRSPPPFVGGPRSRCSDPHHPDLSTPDTFAGRNSGGRRAYSAPRPHFLNCHVRSTQPTGLSDTPPSFSPHPHAPSPDTH